MLVTAALAAEAPAPRWLMQYFYDQDDREFSIVDLAFSSPRRGIAAGVLVPRGRKPKPLCIVTSDGGATWAEVPLKEIPVSLFVLNDNTGWLVTQKGLWRSEEGGRVWKKIKKQEGLRRVSFRDERHGWLTGAPKLFQRTLDGGATWTDVAEVKEVKVAAEHTYFDRLEWLSNGQGLVLGANVAPRAEAGSWMDPEALSRRREWPGVNITLETRDSGATWKTQSAPTFGRFARFVMSPVHAAALSLIRFTNTFDYPSEVYLVDGKGKSTRVYRSSDRSVTDVAWVGKTAYLAAVEPPGKLHQLPIPGRLHVLSSNDLTRWSDMKVDYRALGRQAIFAVAGDQIWVATSSGQILKLAN
jgi:hypothetical protein